MRHTSCKSWRKKIHNGHDDDKTNSSTTTTTDPLLPQQIPTQPIPAPTPTSGDTPRTEVTGDNPVWSPALLKGGFGFFVGFCVGFAMRMFLRMVALVAGINFLVILFAGWLGWVEVRWDVIESQMGPLLTNLGSQFESFQAFVRGSIPTTGLGALGLYTGVRKQ